MSFLPRNGGKATHMIRIASTRVASQYRSPRGVVRTLRTLHQRETPSRRPFASSSGKTDKELLEEAESIDHFVQVGTGFLGEDVSNKFAQEAGFDSTSFDSFWVWTEMQHPLLQKYDFNVNEFARGARMAAKTFFSALLRVTKREHLSEADEKLLRSITTSAGYKLLRLPSGDAVEVGNHQQLEIKVDKIMIPLHKAIHYRIVEGAASTASGESDQESSADASDSATDEGKTDDALSEMVKDLKSGTDRAPKTRATNVKSASDIKPTFFQMILAQLFRYAYLVQKRGEAARLEKYIDYSQYAPGSVVVSIPVQVAFSGSGVKVYNRGEVEAVEFESDNVPKVSIPGEDSKKIQVEWKSSQEHALLYFTGCISGHSELEWRLSFINILND